MKAKEAWRAHILARALAEWSDLTRALARSNVKDNKNNQRRGFDMSAGDIDGPNDNGVQPDGYITVDRETGLLIAAAAKKIIREQLTRLGVTP